MNEQSPSGELVDSMRLMKDESIEQYNDLMDKARFNVKLQHSPAYKYLVEHFSGTLKEWRQQLEQADFTELEGDAGIGLYRVGLLQGHIRCAQLLINLPEVARSFIEADEQLQNMESDDES